MVSISKRYITNLELIVCVGSFGGEGLRGGTDIDLHLRAARRRSGGERGGEDIVIAFAAEADPEEDGTTTEGRPDKDKPRERSKVRRGHDGMRRRRRQRRRRRKEEEEEPRKSRKKK